MSETPSDLKVLNSEWEERLDKTAQCSIGVEISEHLQKAMLRMTGKFLTESTGTVDYESLRNSSEFGEYCSLAAQLKHVDLSAFSQKELFAFFVNTYNALTVHSICDIQKTKNIATTLDVPNFWGSHAYEIGGCIFTLDDIEHGILRGNRPHPSSGQPLLKGDDPRLRHTMRNVDPRVHFALNCGAKSCPVVRVYNSNNLESALDAATRSYLSQEVHLDEKNGIVKIPQILEWYREDFAENQLGMIKWIEPYMQPAIRQAISSLLASDEDITTKIQYYYDWSLNKA